MKWTPTYDPYGFPAIDLANRYLTSIQDIGDLDILPVTERMDPEGFLRKALGSGKFWAHTPDNEVICRTREEELNEEDGFHYRYVAISSNQFIQ